MSEVCDFTKKVACREKCYDDKRTWNTLLAGIFAEKKCQQRHIHKHGLLKQSLLSEKYLIKTKRGCFSCDERVEWIFKRKERSMGSGCEYFCRYRSDLQKTKELLLMQWNCSGIPVLPLLSLPETTIGGGTVAVPEQ